MKIGLASDHGGFELKRQIKDWLAKRDGVEVSDFGTYSAESVDYPDFAAQVARRVSDGTLDRGILVCTTGTGMAITANKFPGVRAAQVFDPRMARLAREHNNANVLCLGERVTGPGLALAITKVFFSTDFEGGRHQRRVQMFDNGLN